MNLHGKQNGQKMSTGFIISNVIKFLLKNIANLHVNNDFD